MSLATAPTHALDLHARIREAHARYVGAEHDLALLLAAFAGGRLFQDLGYVTLQAYADAVLDPEGVGFDVTWAGAIPFVGDVDGYLDAPRVSIQSFRGWPTPPRSCPGSTSW